MKTSVMLLELLFNALVGANYQAVAFSVGSSTLTMTTLSNIGYDTTVRRKLETSSALFGTIEQEASKGSNSHSLQGHDIDRFDDRESILGVGNSETPEPFNLPTKRSVDLYALRVPILNQEGYIALFLSNETAVSFCKDVSKTLYEDSEKVFLHLDVKLGNSTTTNIPVREDSAIGFCRRLKKHEQSGDGGLAPPTETSSLTSGIAKSSGSSTAEEKVTTTRPSKADKSTITNTAKVKSIKDVAEPPEATVSESGEVAAPSGTDDSALRTRTRKLIAPTLTPTSDAGAAQLSTLVEPSPLQISTTVPKTTLETLTTTRDPTGKQTISASPDMSTDEDDSPPDTDLLPGNPRKASKSAETPMPVASSSDSSPSGSNNGLPILTEGTASKEATPLLPIVTPPPPPPSTTNAEGKAFIYQTSGTAGRHLTVSSINSWYDYINSYMQPATPTGAGAAMNARALENAAGPRIAPAFWKRDRLGILTQLFRRRSSEEDEVSQSASEPTNDMEADEPSPTQSSRVPARPRPSLPTSSLFSKEATKAPAPSQFPQTYLDETTPDATMTPPMSTSPTRTPRLSLTATKDASPTRPSSTMANPETIDYDFPSITARPSQSVTESSLSTETSAPSDADDAANKTDVKAEPDEISMAWGKISDPRMVWTVVLLWMVAALQVVCGLWEFWKMTRGEVQVDLVGRLGWWDEKNRRAG
jgi:hypothetical protein